MIQSSGKSVTEDFGKSVQLMEPYCVSLLPNFIKRSTSLSSVCEHLLVSLVTALFISMYYKDVWLSATSKRIQDKLVHEMCFGICN